jgi:hypothetical protein
MTREQRQAYEEQMKCRRERTRDPDGMVDERPNVGMDKLLQALHAVHTVPREDIAPELKR